MFFVWALGSWARSWH